jgi:hypothetical protein
MAQPDAKLIRTRQHTTVDPLVALFSFHAGSGSAAIAAMNTGRRFVGFEKNNVIFDLAAKRISERE